MTPEPRIGVGGILLLASSASATAASRSASAANGRSFERIRGDKAHPASKGYTCEKALRLDYYQNGRGERLLSPLRRRPDGTFEEIDWDTAIREVAARLAAVRDTYGGETIVYYGGGGQGNHLGGTYGAATRGAFGVRFRTNAIAQEKTGEMLVNGKMFGTPLRGDFEHCEVAFFVGKNPWISHGIPHARTTLKAIATDPDRSMVVIDPRRHRDGRAGRLPPPGATGPRRVAARGDGGSARRGRPRRLATGSAAHATLVRTGARCARARCRSPSSARSAASTRRSCARRRAGSRPRRAWRRSRTSACR